MRSERFRRVHCNPKRKSERSESKSARTRKDGADFTPMSRWQPAPFWQPRVFTCVFVHFRSTKIKDILPLDLLSVRTSSPPRGRTPFGSNFEQGERGRRRETVRGRTSFSGRPCVRDRKNKRKSLSSRLYLQYVRIPTLLDHGVRDFRLCCAGRLETFHLALQVRYHRVLLGRSLLFVLLCLP